MRLYFIVSIFLFLILFASCNDSSSTHPQETYKQGSINIVADESYKPVIEQARIVYEASYPDAHLHITYANYATCLRALNEDSVRLVLLPHQLLKEEEDIMKRHLDFKPAYGVLAWDAIAVITHKQARDSLFDIAELRAILTGKDTRYTPVFDGNELSSTLRYCMDSIIRDTVLPPHLQGAQHSADLIHFVQQHPKSLGFIGVSWVGDKEDSMQLSFLKGVRVALLASALPKESDKYIRPYQANIALQRYPLVRSLWYVLKENYIGLGRGFVNFLSNERGQLLFKRAYLIPAKMNFSVRKMRIRQEK